MSSIYFEECQQPSRAKFQQIVVQIEIELMQKRNGGENRETMQPIISDPIMSIKSDNDERRDEKIVHQKKFIHSILFKIQAFTQ